MNKIKLDPRKLLGFRIVATGESTMALRSPKIGGKGCAIVAGEQAAAGAALKAKVGTKAG